MIKNTVFGVLLLGTAAIADNKMSVAAYIQHMEKRLIPPVIVAFDLDDTLLDNQPSWIAAATAVKGNIFTPEFWRILNNSSCENDSAKTEVKNIVAWHQSQNHTIVIITARPFSENHRLATCLQNTYGQTMPVIFAPDGKTEALQKYKVQVFYGDSDSDITDAKSAGAVPVRIIRSARSINPSPVNIGENEIVIRDSDGF